MEQYLPFLSWIDHQRKAMKELVTSWANINTHAMNYAGLYEQIELLKTSFAPLGGQMQELTLPAYTVVDEQGNRSSVPLGKALHITKRSDAPLKVLLGGHMDTVYSKSSPFQKVSEIDEKRLLGPGVCDMKGGLVILLIALQALEKSPYASKIGWEVIINPDEEIGSPGSFAIFERAAKRNQLGLLFEPSLSDGSLVSERAGSTNLVILIRGKAAHSGRDFEQGRSAIFAAAPLICEIETLNSSSDKNVVVSVGEFRSGNSFNIVPDLAIIRINARAPNPEKMQQIKQAIQSYVEKYGARDGIKIELIEQSTRGPKVLDETTETLMKWITLCGQDLNRQIQYKSSRGVTDGNILASSGLPTIDSLGAMGGEIHTHNEFLYIDSLQEKAKLTALLLMRIGNEEFTLKNPQKAIEL